MSLAGAPGAGGVFQSSVGARVLGTIQAPRSVLGPHSNLGQGALALSLCLSFVCQLEVKNFFIIISSGTDGHQTVTLFFIFLTL